jgi:hypothetical protein
MRKSLLLIVAAAAMSLSAQAPSLAQNSPQPIVTFKAEDVAGILREAGYRAEIGPANETPRVRTGMGGYIVDVALYNCDNERNCRNLQYSLGLRDMQKFPLASINKWNVEKRFARAYLDDNGNLWLRGDVYFYGGVTKQMIGGTTLLFDDLVGDFRSMLQTWSAGQSNPFAAATH